MSDAVPETEVRLEAGGLVLRDWTDFSLTRSLTDICGGFQFNYDDQVRMESVMPRPRERFDMVGLVPLTRAKIYLTDELVLQGWIEEVDFEVSGDQVRASISGRDDTAFLIECSANPQGPAEYKGLTVLEIARKLCSPFGIPVRADVDVGAPLADYGIDVGETVMSAIDKAAKQRALLVTSDGIGNLVLTRSGLRRAPTEIRLPGNVLSGGARLSSKDRFSDYWVKGHSRHQRHGRKAALGGTAHPLTSRAPDGSTTSSHSRRPVSTAGLEGTAYAIGQSPPLAATTSKGRERPAIIGTGHAVDPDIKVYRPKVFTTRTQSGGAPNQVLAEWRMRIARGKSTLNRWLMPGFHLGSPARLWRPNEVASIVVGSNDPYDALVAGVTYAKSDSAGSTTQLVVTGREAYDLEPLPDQHRRHGKHAGVGRGSNVANTGGREK